MSVQTWVCGRDNGSEEQAVGKEEIPVQLPHLLHQRHAAVHQQPEVETDHSGQTVYGRLNLSVATEYEIWRGSGYSHPMTKQETTVPRKA